MLLEYCIPQKWPRLEKDGLIWEWYVGFVYQDSTQFFFVMLRLPQIQNLEHIGDSKVFGPEIDNPKAYFERLFCT